MCAVHNAVKPQGRSHCITNVVGHLLLDATVINADERKALCKAAATLSQDGVNSSSEVENCSDAALLG